MLTLPARGDWDAGSPIRLPPVGAALRRTGVHRLRLGVRVLRLDKMRGVSCVPDVKPRRPGADCVLRLRDGLENGKRLSGTYGERHSKEVCAGRVIDPARKLVPRRTGGSQGEGRL